MEDKEKNKQKKETWLIDWLVLMAYQFVLGHFIPKG